MMKDIFCIICLCRDVSKDFRLGCRHNFNYTVVCEIKIFIDFNQFKGPKWL